MENCQYQDDLTEMVREESENNEVAQGKTSEEIYQLDKEPFPELYEETSYHELRCLSNDDFNNSITHFTSIRHDESMEQSFENECCTIRNYPEDCITSRSLENTDDQLFIEVVKEEIHSNSGMDEEVSLFDSISFNIEDDDAIFTQIKIIDDGSSMNDSSKFLFLKNNRNTNEDIPHVVRIKKRRSRKPMGLANYRNLITDAINSSPEKRLLLTDIYKWVMENVPFFKEKDDRGKNGWKNCIRHTLSVNERFMRVKNKTNGRSSYWTVCEEGEFHTKFAEIPWASEIYKPEERKRKPKNKVVNNKVNKLENSLNIINSKERKTSSDRLIDKKNGKNKVVSVKITKQKSTPNKSTDEITNLRDNNRRILKKKPTNVTSHVENGKTPKVNKVKKRQVIIPSSSSMVTRRKKAVVANKEELNIKTRKSKLKNTSRGVNKEKAQSNKRRKKTAKSQAINRENLRRSKRRKNAKKSWKF